MGGVGVGGVEQVGDVLFADVGGEVLGGFGDFEFVGGVVAACAVVVQHLVKVFDGGQATGLGGGGFGVVEQGGGQLCGVGLCPVAVLFL